MNTITLLFSAICGFLVTYILGYPVIPYLKKLKFGQTILDIGPAWHKSKEGTPTMGGVILIIAFVVTAALCFAVDVIGDGSLIAEMSNGQEATTFFSTIGLAVAMGLIGFLDDYIKVVKKRNLGLTAKQKTFLQLLASFLYLFSMRLGGLSYTWLPFVGFIDVTKGAGLLFWPISLIFIYGFVNAVNLTDGIDGLASGVTMVVCAIFMLLSALTGKIGINILSVAAAGCCVGFLVWNLNPAKVFMGDTGSLFLGGLVVGLAFATGRPILLIFVGLVYLLEALSVVLQVAYFKKTKKRLFKMSPVHHHFEMCGWKENKIVLVFSTVSLFGGLLALLLFVYC
ncbi:MAG: phospho-N-acetylmuramoyl-pentapeptide-transferase [Clostridia bacterium]|nr:phospho-N-acetylmuramoyl-pentapeptide-transferase [Clostridia bacterium]